MSIRDIIIIPDARLKQPCAPVDKIDDAVRLLAADMLETMYEAPGIGLAAPQIGVMRRLVTVDISRKDEPKAPLVLINPRLTWVSEELSVYQEGCLSIPEYYEDVERPASIRFAWTTLEGEEKEMQADGLLATCVQHEIDHLDGILFIDHLSRLKRERVMTKFIKAAKKGKTRREDFARPDAEHLAE